MPQPDAVDEVAGLAGALIAIDTTNTDDPAVPGTERPAAEFVAERLADAGYHPEYVESGAPGRGNVVVRLPGADPGRDLRIPGRRGDRRLPRRPLAGRAPPGPVRRRHRGDRRGGRLLGD